LVASEIAQGELSYYDGLGLGSTFDGSGSGSGSGWTWGPRPGVLETCIDHDDSLVIREPGDTTDIGIDICTDIGTDIDTDIGFGTVIGTDIGTVIGTDIGTDIVQDKTVTCATPPSPDAPLAVYGALPLHKDDSGVFDTDMTVVSGYDTLSDGT